MGIEIINLNTVKKICSLSKTKPIFQMERDCRIEQPFNFMVLRIKISQSWVCLVITEDDHVSESVFAAGEVNPKSSWYMVCSGGPKESVTEPGEPQIL